MDAEERKARVEAPMRMSRPALAVPPRSVSDRLRALLSHASALSDAHQVEDVYKHALDALVEVLGAHRGAVAVLDAQGRLKVGASGGFSPLSLAAIEALSMPPVGDGAALVAALAPDGVAAVNVWLLREDEGPVGLIVAAYDAPHESDGDETRMADILASQDRKSVV